MIDWGRVRQLREEIGNDDFIDVVDLFLEEVDTVITTLKADTSSRDAEAPLHFLKGSALSLGFVEFARLCEVGEVSAKAGNQISLQNVFDSYEESRAAFITGIESNLTD